MMTVVHVKHAPYDVYIGRRNARAGLPESKWHNPFHIGRDGTREEVIAQYTAWVVTQPALMAALPELKGKRLGCWCRTTPRQPGEAAICHGDILAEMVEGLK